MTYEFTCYSEDGSEVTMRFTAVTHTEITEKYIQFIRGCGFYLPATDGWLEFDRSEATDWNNTEETEK